MKKNIKIIYSSCMHKILLVFLLVQPSLLLCQELKIKTLYENDDLGYAYIFINNKIYGATDSLGTLYIPLKDIHTNDTISASFLGCSKDYIVYDYHKHKNQEIVFHLLPNIELSEVTVAVDVLDLFKKYVKKHQYANNFSFSSITGSNFQTSKKWKDGKESTSHGNISIKGHNASATCRILNFKAEGDTIGLRNDIAYFIRITAWEIYAFNKVRNDQQSKRWFPDYNLNYLGIKGQYRLFTLTRHSEKMVSQILYKIDKDTKLLVSIEYHNIYMFKGKQVLEENCNIDFYQENNKLYIREANIVLKSSDKEYYRRIWKLSENNSFIKNSKAYLQLFPEFSPHWTRFFHDKRN